MQDYTSDLVSGRLTALRALNAGQATADVFIGEGPAMVAKWLSVEDYGQAEFWVGMQSQARTYLLANAEYSMRNRQATHEICRIIVADENTNETDEIHFFCEREQTGEMLPQVYSQITGRIMAVLITPAFWDEIGHLFLTDYNLEE